MPVYNAMPYLDAAIESILAQSHRDFEFVIYDDSSTDGSYERALEWAARDPRIMVTRGKSRLGPCGSSQCAARLAGGEFVARMDADDVALPERLRLQSRLLRENSGAALIGSTHEIIDHAGRVMRRVPLTELSGATPPIPHPGIMYRHTAFSAAGGYRPGTDYFEDQDLYRRISREGAVLVINRPLIQMRFAGQHNRRREDPLRVLRQIDRLYSEHGNGEGTRDRISLWAFYSVAVLAILHREPPRLTTLMLRHARFEWSITSGLIASMIALAEVAPGLVRGLAHLRTGVREFLARGRFVEGQVYRWQCP